ncbi:MAG: GNAT family N-acetyltransferase [Spirochaetales bacterium]|nr:GNAT family N-acetyltransferase [Spirochaetales bacterium]
MIETERLFIRKFIKNDWADLYEYLSLKEIYVFEPGEPVSRDEAKRLADERSKGDDFLAVVLKERNKMIGHLYFHHEDPKEYMTWELGYIFNPVYQRKGYCTEACKHIIDYAFKQLNAHRIVSYCNPKNIASWRVLEKTGMKREGYFREKAFFRRDENGNPLWHDCLAYGLLSYK